jgi:hypothetical protein
MKKRFLIHQVFKALIIISSGLGLLLSFIESNDLSPMLYFTNQSNLFIFIVYLVFLVKHNNYHEPYISILYQAVLAIVLTGIVYHLMLRPYIDPSVYSPNSLSNLLVHTFTPIFVVIERIVFSRKGILQRKHPFIWLSFPMLYYVFVLVYGTFGGKFHSGTDYASKYPYFFLNIGEEGIGYFLLVILFIIVIGQLIYLSNRYIFTWKKK